MKIVKNISYINQREGENWDSFEPHVNRIRVLEEVFPVSLILDFVFSFSVSVCVSV